MVFSQAGAERLLPAVVLVAPDLMAIKGHTLIEVYGYDKVEVVQPLPWLGGNQ